MTKDNRYIEVYSLGLHKAVDFQDLERVKFFLSLGADPNLQNNQLLGLYSLASKAIDKKNLEIFNLLVSSGMEIPIDVFPEIDNLPPSIINEFIKSVFSTIKNRDIEDILNNKVNNSNGNRRIRSASNLINFLYKWKRFIPPEFKIGSISDFTIRSISDDFCTVEKLIELGYTPNSTQAITLASEVIKQVNIELYPDTLKKMLDLVDLSESKEGLPLIVEVIRKGSVSWFEVIIEKGFDPNKDKKTSKFVLELILSQPNAKDFIDVLNKYNFDFKDSIIEETIIKYFSLCSEGDHKETIESLIESGVNINCFEEIIELISTKEIIIKIIEDILEKIKGKKDPRYGRVNLVSRRLKRTIKSIKALNNVQES